MKPAVYLETTIIGYLAIRVSGILRIAANQQTTRDWWDGHRHNFDLFVSRFVVDECSDGDPAAAEERLANPAMRPRIECICRDLGFEPPVICTPQGLLEIDDEI
ncbi:MAG TPA: hypothetical protein ENJ50_09845 [Planctomycetaceae bacterium]|nr:hypothetical protein [Planctomycetaceae bacterium]